MTHPSSYSCFFCGARADQGSTLEVPMFLMKDFRGSNQGIAKSARMQYESEVHRVPRCPSCRRRHRIETGSKKLLGWVVLLAVFSVILLARGSASGLAGAGLAVTLLLVGPLLVTMLIFLPIGAKARSRRFERRREWPGVRSALAGGWQLGDKPSMSDGAAWARPRQEALHKQRRVEEGARRETEAARRRVVGYRKEAEKMYFDHNVRGLLRMVQSRDLKERRAAISMLGMVEEPAALETLLRLLADPAQLPLHGAAARALVFYQDPRVVPAIQAAIKALPADGEGVNLAKADMILALDHRSNPDAINMRPKGRAKGRLSDSAARRSKAYQLYAEGHIADLVQMAVDRDNADRDLAIRLLGDARDPAALESLLGLLLDPAEEAWHGRVARALVHYDDPRNDPAIEAAHQAVGRRDLDVEAGLRNALYERAHPPEYMIWVPLSRDEARQKATEWLK